MTCAFYSNSQLSLMTSAGTGYAAWNNLCSVRQVSLQSWNIFVIDVFDFIHAERTNFFSAFSVFIKDFEMVSKRPIIKQIVTDSIAVISPTLN